jgi:hypothetical protein
VIKMMEERYVTLEDTRDRKQNGKKKRRRRRRRREIADYKFKEFWRSELQKI